MVKKFFNILSREISGLHEAAYLLGAFAILSQVLALLRDRLLAYTFGAGATLDLYYAAFRIPDFLFVIVASFFSASIIIPFFSEKVRISKDHGREFLSAMFSVFLMAIVAASAVAFFLAPYLVPKLFPSFAEEPYRSQIITLTRILLLSPIFLGLSNLFASVTQFYNRFFIYGVSPLLYNLGIIFGVVWLVPRFGVIGLVWGVVLGALMHFLVQAPFVLHQKLMPKLVFSLKKYRTVLSVMVVALPRMLALSAQEVSEFFLVSVASFMSLGSISVFTLSWNLQSVPLSIIGVSYSLAAFPTLSALFAAGERGKFVELLETTARYIIFFSLPLVALFAVLRAHIVRIILGSGAFSWQDTRLTAAALAFFVISLAAQGLILLFTRARYAAGNTKKPFYINISSALVTVISAAILSKTVVMCPDFRIFIENLFRVEDVPGTSVLMLPLAFSIGSIFGALIHIYTFNRDYGGVSKSLGRVTFESSLVAFAMGLVSYITLNIASNYFTLDTFLGVFSQGVIAGLSGVMCGIILLALLGNRELKEVAVALHKKIRKIPVIGPDAAGEI